MVGRWFSSSSPFNIYSLTIVPLATPGAPVHVISGDTVSGQVNGSITSPITNDCLVLIPSQLYQIQYEGNAFGTPGPDAWLELAGLTLPQLPDR